MRPGMTGLAGLAQVRGPCATRPKDKVRHGNLYAETLNPWTDIKLLFLSVPVASRGCSNRSTG